MTRSGPGPDQVRPLGPVHSPAGPGPIIWVQVRPYLDLDPDFWGPVRSGPGSARSRTGPWTVYVAKGTGGFLSKGQGRAREDSCMLLRLGGIATSMSRRIFYGSYNKRR